MKGRKKKIAELRAGVAALEAERLDHEREMALLKPVAPMLRQEIEKLGQTIADLEVSLGLATLENRAFRREVSSLKRKLRAATNPKPAAKKPAKRAPKKTTKTAAAGASRSRS